MTRRQDAHRRTTATERSTSRAQRSSSSGTTSTARCCLPLVLRPERGAVDRHARGSELAERLIGDGERLRRGACAGAQAGHVDVGRLFGGRPATGRGTGRQYSVRRASEVTPWRERRRLNRRSGAVVPRRTARASPLRLCVASVRALLLRRVPRVAEFVQPRSPTAALRAVLRAGAAAYSPFPIPLGRYRELRRRKTRSPKQRPARVAAIRNSASSLESRRGARARGTGCERQRFGSSARPTRDGAPELVSGAARRYAAGALVDGERRRHGRSTVSNRRRSSVTTACMCHKVCSGGGTATRECVS